MAVHHANDPRVVVPRGSAGRRRAAADRGLMLLEGRAAVVAGVGPGIGREAALALAREGADVALGARTEDRLREVAAEIEARGRKAVWAPTNIAKEDDCAALADACLQ